MWVYRNARTGQVAELPARSTRLDALANWQLIGTPVDEEPDPTGVGRMLPDTAGGGAAPAVAEGDLSAMVAAALEAAGPPTAPRPPDTAPAVAEGDLPALEEAEPPTVPRPPDAAPKPVWVAYAVARGATESDARALSKAALIEEWGGPDGED